MTVSQPSSLIYNVDVPEIKKFDGIFHYNFFTSDETITDIPVNLKDLVKLNETFDNSQLAKFVELKSPRNIQLNWENPSIVKNIGTFQSKQNAVNLIGNNLDKLISEDELATFRYASIALHDSQVDDKAYNLISASFDILTIDHVVNKVTTVQNLALQLNSILAESYTDQSLIKSVMSKDNSIVFIDNNTISKSPLLENAKKFSINTQVNTTIMSDILAASIDNPFNPHYTSLHQLKTLADQIKNNNNISINYDEFATIIPSLETTTIPNQAAIETVNAAQIVGYVIRKYEVDTTGKLLEQTPIVVENPLASTAYDFKVRYGANYIYTIESVALYQLQATDEITLRPAIIKFLVSSKPSAKIKVTCTEDIAPPPPNDIKLTWNYQDNKLHVAWSFPTNKQQDIQKFQVFRRASLNQPFELIKEYDFNAAATKVQFENIPSNLTQNVTSPVTNFVDDDFVKTSKYIYTVCSIDAHGLTSNYGAQFEASFDVFKNTLIKKLISHSGAPKQYPNLFVENDVFTNTLKISNSNKITVYFSPVCLNALDENGSFTKIVSMNQDGGSYKLALINLDNQTPADVVINIDNKVLE